MPPSSRRLGHIRCRVVRSDRFGYPPPQLLAHAEAGIEGPGDCVIVAGKPDAICPDWDAVLSRVDHACLPLRLTEGLDEPAIADRRRGC